MTPFINFKGGRWILRPYNDLITRRSIATKGNERIVSLFFNCWIALLADSPLSDDGPKPRSLVYKFHKELVSQPLQLTLHRYTDLCHYMYKHPTLYGAGSLTGSFNHDMLTTPIAKEYISWYKTADPTLFKYITSFLSFGRKLSYQDSELDTTAFRGWLSSEERLANFTLPVDSDNVKACVTYLLGESIPEVPFMARHGSGSTSEGVRNAYDKLQHLSYHPKLVKGFYLNYFSKLRCEVNHDREHLPSSLTWVSTRCIDIARIKFVPKTYKTARSICMEPVSFMYFQQHYRWELEQRLLRGPIRHHVVLRDQTRNRRRALSGSITGNLDTIDLSAASDSIHVSLIKGLFPRPVAFKLLATRTSRVKHGEEIIDVQKFAPMGSALCFPVQCIIFAALTHYAYLIVQRADGVTEEDFRKEKLLNLKPNFGQYAHNRLESYSIYGDDIICDSRVTQVLYRLLDDYGFLPNREKSFTGSQAFRESCGGYYYNGHDVTPILFRIKHHNQKLDDKLLASFLAMIDLLGDHSMHTCRSYLIRMLRFHYYVKAPKGRDVWCRPSVLFSSSRDKELSIYSTNPHNNHLATRNGTVVPMFSEAEKINRKSDSKYSSADIYRREEYYCVRSKRANKVDVKKYDANLIENYEYQQWWRTRYQGSEVTSRDPRKIFSFGVDTPLSTECHTDTKSLDTRISWGWTPAY